MFLKANANLGLHVMKKSEEASTDMVRFLVKFYGRDALKDKKIESDGKVDIGTDWLVFCCTNNGETHHQRGRVDDAMQMTTVHIQEDSSYLLTRLTSLAKPTLDLYT